MPERIDRLVEIAATGFWLLIWPEELEEHVLGHSAPATEQEVLEDGNCLVSIPPFDELIVDVYVEGAEAIRCERRLRAPRAE
jgi:hypothetical protein